MQTSKNMLKILTIFWYWCLSRTMAEIYVARLQSQFNFVEYEDMPALFGAKLGDRVFRGMLSATAPEEDVCNRIRPPPGDVDNETGRWAVLVARSNSVANCSFVDKVRLAQHAGYDAIIVHNVHSEQLITMGADNASDIYVAAVFVGETTGHELAAKATPDYFIVITGSSFNFQTHLLIPFAIVVGICFTAMLIFMVVKCVKDCRRRRRHRMPTSTLNKIPTCKYQKGSPYETCAICLDDYVEGEKLRVLPCNHVYHTKCIDPWLTKNKRVCPICKRKVFAHDEPSNDSDDTDSDPDDTTPLISAASNRNQQHRGGGGGGGLGGAGGGGGLTDHGTFPAVVDGDASVALPTATSAATESQMQPSGAAAQRSDWWALRAVSSLFAERTTSINNGDVPTASSDTASTASSDDTYSSVNSAPAPNRNAPPPQPQPPPCDFEKIEVCIHPAVSARREVIQVDHHQGNANGDDDDDDDDDDADDGSGVV